jgi:hypothetical protein
VKFCGAIADTYNSTTDTHRQRTLKNLKDHWSTYNKQVYVQLNLQSRIFAPQRSDTRIGLVALNSSTFIGGKL